MDFHLKQWRNHDSEHEQEQPPSAKIPKLLLDPAPLPLFAPELTSTSKLTNFSAFQDSSQLPSPASATTRSYPKMGGSYFSLAQWQELELQALIYRYMLAGATVPPELLNPIKKSLLHSSPYNFLHHPLQHYSCYQPALLQTGYWGRAAMDPEPGRCRRTDGKKWRCSRDVVAGQKYCERHVHRGRNRSRKPVEIPTPTSATNTTTSIGISGGGGGGGAAAGGGFNSSSSIAEPSPGPVTNGNNFCLSGQSSSTELLHFNNGSPSDTKPEIKGLLGPQSEIGHRSQGRILRHFFDDWPRPVQGQESNVSQRNSAICLSISMPGNSASSASSDVSLKLATGDGEEVEGHRGSGREQPQVNWSGGWATTQVASMGGPLAEALGSSNSNSSPTSVLHYLPRGSASETSFVSI